MSRIRLFIVDVDPVHTINVCKSIASISNIEIIGTEEDGSKALKRISALHPDVLLTDIQLPGLDGIGLLKEIQLLRHPPITIVCTRFYSDISLEYAYKHGAAYFLYKPVEYHMLPEIISECYKSFRNDSRRNTFPNDAQQIRLNDISRIRNLLIQMSISPKLIGSLYMTESVLRLKENFLLIRNLSKGLYAEIAAQMNTTPSRIERSLRNAIATAYEHGTLRQYFKHRPTNKEFIQYILSTLNDDDSSNNNQTVDM